MILKNKKDAKSSTILKWAEGLTACSVGWAGGQLCCWLLARADWLAQQLQLSQGIK